MKAGTTFVPDRQATIAMQPGNGAFHDPAGLAEATAVGRAAFRQERLDAGATERVAVRPGVVAAVPLHALGAAPGAAGAPADRRNGVNQRDQLRDVMALRGGHDHAERNPLRVRDEVVLTARLAAIGWVRSSFFPPRSARTEPLSTIARVQSSRWRRRSSVSSTRCSRVQTPARCQAANRRQHVVPEPQPICAGSMFQGIPVRRTKRIPVSTARSGIGVRPAYWRLRGLRLGSNGSMRVHNSSSIAKVAMRNRLRVGYATVPKPGKKYKS